MNADAEDGDGIVDGEQLIAGYLDELEREAARLPWNTRSELLEDVRSHIEVALSEADGAGSTDAADAADTADAAEAADAVEVGHAAGTPPTRAQHIRRILAALGEPREIVAAALEDEPVPPPQEPVAVPTPPYGTYGIVYPASSAAGPPYALGLAEIAAIVLLLFGAFLWGIGWIVGLVLLWTSPRWTLRERLIGTFAVPGGLGGVILFGTLASQTKSCGGVSTPSGIVVEHCTTSGWAMPPALGVPVFLAVAFAPIVTAIYLVRKARRRPGSNPRRAVAGVGPAIGGAVVLVLTVAFGYVLLAGGSGKTGIAPARPDTTYEVPTQSPGASQIAETSPSS